MSNGGGAVKLEVASEPDSQLSVPSKPEPIQLGEQRGIRARLIAHLPEQRSATIGLQIQGLVAGSMRGIRDVRDGAFSFNAPSSKPFSVAFQSRDNSLVAVRRSVDGITNSRLLLTPLAGCLFRQDESGLWRLYEKNGGAIEFEIEATTDERPLTPIPIEDVVSAEVLHESSPHDLAELNYLIYRESLLAGADNYLTMFGRDNELFLTIGEAGLKPEIFEVVLSSQLNSMLPDGNLAHEPGIGEFAAIKNREKGSAATRAPVFDYHMIDTRFLLATTALTYLIKTEPQRAAEFFSHTGSGGQSFFNRMLKNFESVVIASEPFARNPVYSNLISIAPGAVVGNWRDSETGLGGGRYPFDVNVALLPGALDAIVAISERLQDPTLSALASRARAARTVWRAQAWDFFQVALPRETALNQARRYTTELKMQVTSQMLDLKDDVYRFPAIALDREGAPVPVVHSDGGFCLLYRSDLTDDQILQILHLTLLPFPLGLDSEVGTFVSNGAFTDWSLRRDWTFSGYHKVVVWPWQEFLFLKGLDRQLQRTDLHLETTEELRKAEQYLWKRAYAMSPYLGIELYTAAVRGAHLAPAAFSGAPGQETVSTIIQAWSKLSLLVRPPARVSEGVGRMPSSVMPRRFVVDPAHL